MDSPDPPTNTAPPPPTPDMNDAAEGAQRLEEDLRKNRSSTSGSYLSGGNMASAAPGRGYLG